MKPSDDPRQAGGTIAGPGGPHDRNATVLDLTNALIVSGWVVAETELHRAGQATEQAVALVIEGHINRPPDQRDKPADEVEFLNLLDGEAAASLVVDLVALAGRAGKGEAFLDAIQGKSSQYDDDGLMSPQNGTEA